MTHSPDQATGDVSIVILSHNRVEELRRNLPALIRAVHERRWELIVVDNASNDGSQALLESLTNDRAGVRLLLSSENLGVARGRNLGWREADREFVLNLDDDTAVTVSAVDALARHLRNNGGCGLAFPKILHPKTGLDQTALGDSPVTASNFHGACHIIRRSAYEEVGAIDEVCAFGGEELDYSIRLRASGWTVDYVPEVVVTHNNLVRQGAEARWRREQWTYNYARVLFKHFSSRRAALYAGRLWIGHSLSGTASHGPSFSIVLAKATVRGARAGRRAHHKVPYAVEKLYADQTMSPEYGNAPVVKKLIARLRRGYLASRGR